MTGDSGTDRADPAEAADAQSEIVRALADPAFHPGRPASVEHLQTHISHVFLAGPYVYKLKKPVRFPYLDFSTLARREAACRAELALNRRLAPDVYKAVAPILCSHRGLAIGGPIGEPAGRK